MVRINLGAGFCTSCQRLAVCGTCESKANSVEANRAERY
jgi:hypothetical protein